MSEAELLLGLGQALTMAGWLWYHVVRSDGVSSGSGALGFPDIVAVHPRRLHLILWELKGSGGTPTPDQWAWMQPLALLAGTIGTCTPQLLDARILWPADYDTALEYIVGKREAMPT